MREMFQPNLVLVREPDGEYTVESVTITPNSAYGRGRARVAAPPNVRLLPEVLPILLNITHRSGMALQVLTPVRHRLHDLKLEGKKRVTAFTVVGGQVVGSTSIAVDEHAASPADKPRAIPTSNWYAWANRMPGGSPSLHVIGTVSAPTPGYAATLAPAAPQGINPRDLILNLTITHPRGGFWPAVVTPVQVTYVDNDYQGNYDTVLVRTPDGESIQIQIEDVF